MGSVLPFPNKHTYIFIFLFTLIAGCYSVKAQDSKAVDVTTKGIQIGQQVPDITITNIHNYKTNSAKISDFKGKLLIIDFWATWCSPCIAMIPKMDSLQKQFGDKIQFLSVTYESEKVALPFLSKLQHQQKKHYNLPIVTDSKKLNGFFPHIYLPHYVWIDASGKVAGITNHQEVNETAIMSFLSKGTQMQQKKDEYRPYNLKKLLRSNVDDGDIQISYSSTLTKYINGLNPVMDVSVDSIGNKKISVLNCPLMLLYRTSLRDRFVMSKNRISIETVDSNLLNSNLKGIEYLNWLKDGNGFCYELKVEPSLSKNIYELMRDDLRLLFPKYRATLEIRNKEVFVLKRTSQVDKLKTVGEAYSSSFSINGCKLVNTYIIQFVNELNMVYQQNVPFPIIDKTGYTGKVDIELEANLTNINSINSALARYDLTIEKSIEPVEILVIKDTPLITTK